MRYSSEFPAAHTDRASDERYRQGTDVLIMGLLCLLVLAPPLLGQTAVPSSNTDNRTSAALPDDPHPNLESSDGFTAVDRMANLFDTNVGPAPTINVNSPPAYGRQTKRVLYIVPNFHSVSAGSQLPPQSAKGKLLNATEDSFDYSSFIFNGILAGVGQAENATPEFGHGGVGYGRYYWHTFVDQTDENYFVEGFMPILFRQDTRYYTLGRGGFLRRTFYAVSRAAITRTDAGNPVANYSEIIGAGAAAGISNLYYPSQERTWTKTGQRWALNVGLDVLSQTFREFWPDVNRKIFHQ